ncbi:MAG: release factor glutamine methyltransferase [Alphaproteobacteria bacterium]|jgi:release factor glutamine methyltransferase
MKIKDALQQAVTTLKGVSDSAALDASLLMSHATGLTKIELFMRDENVLTEMQLNAFDALIVRRQTSEPIAYILGEKEFWALPFKVVPSVLIPRPDTETMVATLVAAVADKNAEGLVADLGVGSGALLLSILSEFEKFKGVGVDMNDTALEIARENAINLGFSDRATFVKSHWLDAVDEMFDIVVSNPPYIETSTVASLMDDVKDHEPMSALDGGADGLACYRSLIPSAYDKLNKGGLLLLEIGYNQKETVSHLLSKGWKNVQCFKDLAGHDRVIAAIKTEK